MAEFRWIKTNLFFILVLQFTAAATGQQSPLTVRAGDDVTLSCENKADDQVNCDGTTWLFRQRLTSQTELVNHGQLVENAKSDRLNITEKCSLVMKKVTDEDAGYYSCIQDHKTEQQSFFRGYEMSVLRMTEQKDNKEVTLTCSVSPYGECEHTVTWLNEDEDNKDMMTSPSDCSASVTTSLPESKHHEFFKCEVIEDFSGNTKQFIYLDSDEKTGEDEKTSTSKPTTTTTTTTATNPTLTKTTATKPPATTTASWWWFIILPVVLAALFVVVLIRWKRSKGNKTQVDANTADSEDGVSYTSVSFTKTTNSKAQVQGNVGDDEGDAVTYSTVKASSSA